MVQTETVILDELQVQVVRTQRKKTLSVQIEQGQVRILVPRTLAWAEIEAMVAKKARWIQLKLAEQQQVQPLPAKEYMNGEAFYLLGRNYRLQIVTDAPSAHVDLDAGRLRVHLPTSSPSADQIRSAVIKWYKAQAVEVLLERVQRYERLMKVSATSVVVKKYKARWGSCYADGRISFNWLIIMAPSTVIDYVVVHELCHLVHMNHSPEFWQIVKRYHPGYAEAKQWLKEYGAELHLL